MKRRWLCSVILGLVILGLNGSAQPTISLVGSDVVLTFPTASNMLYNVQRADNLTTADWSSIASNIIGTGETVTNIDYGAATADSLFYRVASYTPSTNGGTAVVQVQFTDGAPVPSALIILSYGGNPQRSGTTDANGQHIFTNIPVGSFNVVVYSPNNGNVVVNGAGNISHPGDIAVADVSMPGTGSVEVWVSYTEVDPAPMAPVYIVSGTTTNGPGYTDAAGHLTMSGIPEGNFVVTAYDPTNLNAFVSAPGNLPTNGASATLYLTVP